MKNGKTEWLVDFSLPEKFQMYVVVIGFYHLVVTGSREGHFQSDVTSLMTLTISFTPHIDVTSSSKVVSILQNNFFCSPYGLSRVAAA